MTGIPSLPGSNRVWLLLAGLLGLLLALAAGFFSFVVPRSRPSETVKTAFAPLVRMNPDRVRYEYFLPSGERRSYENDQGRIVCVLFWATWAQPGRELLPWLAQLARQYQSCGLTVIAFALDNDPAAVNKWVHDHHIPFACPVVPQGAWAAAVRSLEGLPVLMLVDRQGKIYRRYSGLTVRERLEDDILGLLQKKE